MPERFNSVANETVTIELHNGEHFEGEPVRFNEALVGRLSVHGEKRVDFSDLDVDINGHVVLPIERSGTTIVVYEQLPRVHSYDSFEGFKTFLTEDGLNWVLDTHLAKGFPQDRVSEQYRRFAKSLIQANNHELADQRVDLELELVVLDRIADEQNDKMQVQLVYQGEPLADVQVSVFEEGRSRVGIPRTNAEGIAAFSVEEGRDYLLSAVHLRRLDASTSLRTGAFWESLWTSVTFNTEAG